MENIEVPLILALNFTILGASRLLPGGERRDPAQCDGADEGGHLQLRQGRRRQPGDRDPGVPAERQEDQDSDRHCRADRGCCECKEHNLAV